MSKAAGGHAFDEMPKSQSGFKGHVLRAEDHHFEVSHEFSAACKLRFEFTCEMPSLDRALEYCREKGLHDPRNWFNKPINELDNFFPRLKLRLVSKDDVRLILIAMVILLYFQYTQNGLDLFYSVKNCDIFKTDNSVYMDQARKEILQELNAACGYTNEKYTDDLISCIRVHGGIQCEYHSSLGIGLPD